jgi:xylan 1,4-beta-xylosidase
VVKIYVNKECTRVNNFWNAVHFHPTDAIEDEWGRKIIDEIAAGKAAGFMRIYAMLEDIVSGDGKGGLTYDFSLSDKRIDYLVQKGFRLLICFNFMPDCIASVPDRDMGIPRYKGKRVNNSVPVHYRLWEEVCFKYMKHLLERYGEERLSEWRFHCWNEPDHEYWVTSKTCFDYDRDNDDDKIKEYIKLYDYFLLGVTRAFSGAKIGGPSAAASDRFLRSFIEHVASEDSARLDFLSMHAYSDIKYEGTDGKMCPENILKRAMLVKELLDKYGLGGTEIIIDEWGAAAGGFLSIKKNPEMVFRENEYFAAFYFRLIELIAKSGVQVSKMLICLSGQHKSVSDFDGYRSFFTLSGYKKPIYNAYCLSARLGEHWLDCSGENCIPTVNENGDIVIAVYSLKSELEKISLKLSGLCGCYEFRRTRIDRNDANSYGAWLEAGAPERPDNSLKKYIRERGELETFVETIYSDGAYSYEAVFEGAGVELIELIKTDDAGGDKN